MFKTFQDLVFMRKIEHRLEVSSFFFFWPKWKVLEDANAFGLEGRGLH